MNKEDHRADRSKEDGSVVGVGDAAGGHAQDDVKAENVPHRHYSLPWKLENAS